MDVGLVVGVGAAGVALGPAANLLIDRIPDRQPLWPPTVTSRSRWALVSVANGVLFALAANRFGSTWVLLPFLLFYAALLVVSVIDLQVLRIPDRIVFPTLAISVPAIVAVSLAYDVPSAIRSALTGAFIYFGILLVPHLISPRGMGFGDVKLAGVMGLYVGWLGVTAFDAFYLVLIALFLGALLGAVVGIAVSIIRRKRGAFPFGPTLALGSIIVTLASNQLMG